MNSPFTLRDKISTPDSSNQCQDDMARDNNHIPPISTRKVQSRLRKIVQNLFMCYLSVDFCILI